MMTIDMGAAIAEFIDKGVQNESERESIRASLKYANESAWSLIKLGFLAGVQYGVNHADDFEDAGRGEG
jgi:hypothetical protein